MNEWLRWRLPESLHLEAGDELTFAHHEDVSDRMLAEVMRDGIVVWRGWLDPETPGITGEKNGQP